MLQTWASEKLQPNRGALDALAGDPLFASLGAMEERFNLFDALGVVRHELRHSDLLAFLLDPRQKHGIGDAFLRRFLGDVLRSSYASSPPVTAEELAHRSFGNVSVLREEQFVDILLLDHGRRLAVIIENKIDSDERPEQLARYWRAVEQRHPGWRRLGIFLTPTGEEPSHLGYLPISYGLVCESVEGVVANTAHHLAVDVRVLLEHYARMLRRHIVGDSEASALVRQLYAKHWRACEAIFLHRHNRQTLVYNALLQLLPRSESEPLVRDGPTRDFINFAVRAWDARQLLRGKDWTASRRMLLFVFVNNAGLLDLELFIGPGHEATRQGLLQMAYRHASFLAVDQESWPGYISIFKRHILAPEEYSGMSELELKQALRARWQIFRDNDLPVIDAIVKAETWLWDNSASAR